jgi:HEAT repeat protein
VVEAIGRMASDASGEVRAAALSALAEMEHPAAAEQVRAALYDPTWEVRAKAAVCASRLLFERAIPRLVQLLEDDHWGVRYSAGEALFQLGPQGQAALIEARRKSGAVAALADTLLAEHKAAA